MSVILPAYLPAYEELRKEGILLPGKARGGRKLKIGLLNLMPLKQMAEIDYLRLLSYSPLDIELTLVSPATHRSRNTSAEHIATYYVTPQEALEKGLDGMIVTGAPVEKIDFEQVDYWPELTGLFAELRNRRIPTLYICWGALAGLYYHHAVPKQIFTRKISGVYPHRIVNQSYMLRGMDDKFYVPHSRYSGVDREDVTKAVGLRLIAESDQSGVYMAESEDFPAVYVTGHSEYSPLTLDFEYHRDMAKGINPEIPSNYYPDDDPDKEPMVLWRSHAHLLFSNWLNQL
ncbi:MAG: homoserine O-succinyltransferase [Paramuribaculum sp.]|nr:homoserine O-succinyltransferase [Paramuribaculum sp.]